MKENIIYILRQHWYECRSFYWFSLVLLFMGVLFGAVLVNSLSLPLKNDLYGFLQSFLVTFENSADVTNREIFLRSFTHHGGYIGLMWVLGLSVAGVPFILILLFLKGVVSGFTIGFLVQQMGASGFFLSFASIFPQNLVIIPVYMVMAVVSIVMSLQIIKHLFKQNRTTLVPSAIGKSVVVFALMLICLGIGAFIEGYFTPIFMRGVIQWFM